MKKPVLGAIIVVVILLLGLMVRSIIQKANEKEQLEAGRSMPPFSFIQMDGTTFSAEQLPDGKPVIIKYFDPGCEHCQSEAAALVADLHMLENIPIIMVTAAEQGAIGPFIEAHQLDRYTQITVLRDTAHQFGPTFGDYDTPCTYVYDAQHRLLEYIRGEIKTSYLQKLIAGS